MAERCVALDFRDFPATQDEVISADESPTISDETAVNGGSPPGAATSQLPPPVKKRQLIGLSGKQKRAICLYKEQNPRLIHTEISDYFTRKWKFKVPLSTVSYILKTKNRWLNQSTAKNYIRLKKHQYQKLHNDLYEWFKEKRMRGDQVTDNMLVEQGKRFGDKLGIVDFPYSPRWLRGFKASHGLSNNPVNAQYCTVVEKPPTAEGLAEDRACGFAYDDIYSFLEMRLAYTTRQDEGAAAAETIQVFLCTNATGSDKLEPLVMGTDVEPPPDAPDGEDRATYKTVGDASHVDAIVRDWLQNVNSQMLLNQRHILLLFHTDRCHRYGNDNFSNVGIMFVPPSDAFHTHLNIAEIFRSHYGNFLLERLGGPRRKTAAGGLRVTLRDALRLVKVSWDRVSEDTIRECWYNEGLETFQKCWKTKRESVKQPDDNGDTAQSADDDRSSLQSTSADRVRAAFAVALQYFQQDVSHKLASHLEHLRAAQQALETVISASMPSKRDFKSLFDSKKD